MIARRVDEIRIHCEIEVKGMEDTRKREECVAKRQKHAFTHRSIRTAGRKARKVSYCLMNTGIEFRGQSTSIVLPPS